MCSSLLYSSSELGECFGVGHQDQSGSVFFVVSLFHGLLMGSRPSFRIQRHALLLMIIRSAGNRFTADSPTNVWPVLSPLDCRGAESICWPPGGKERFEFAQQVINGVLTQCCHAEKKESLEEFGFFFFLLPLSHSQGHGSESIDHYGASELIESGAIASPWKKQKNKKKTWGREEAKVSCMRGQAAGEVCREREKR